MDHGTILNDVFLPAHKPPGLVWWKISDQLLLATNDLQLALSSCIQTCDRAEGLSVLELVGNTRTEQNTYVFASVRNKPS